MAASLEEKTINIFDDNYHNGVYDRVYAFKDEVAEIYKNPHLYFYELDDFAEESMQHWFGKDSEMRKKKLV